MAEIAVSRSGATESTRPATIQVVGFHEGWTSLVLHVLILAITASSIVRVDQAQRAGVLIPLAVAGLLLGYAVARFPAFDALSHFTALFGGIGGALALTAISIDGWSETWDARGRNIYDLGYRIARSQFSRSSGRLSDDDLVVVIAITLWLVAYSSAWMLCRRHWLLPALVMPAVLLFINLRFEEQESTATLAIFAVAALIMAARHQAFMRQIDWARRRVPAPGGLPGRFTASGSLIAIVTLLAGWSLPYQAPSGVVDSVADQFQSRWEQISGKFDSIGNPASTKQGETEVFTSFSDSFRIGGEFVPSQDLVASLQASSPTYLALRRYDFYDGTGWSSDVDSTFRMEGEGDDVTATSVTFTPNQYVAISSDVSTDRELEAGVVTVLKNKDGLLFTTNTFVGATVPTMAILGWKQLPDQPIRVDDVSIASLPVDLQGLVKSLRDAEFVKDPQTGKPVVRDSQESLAIEQERARLLSYPVQTVLSYDTDGSVLVTVSGRLPNYDDIEAVFANVPVKAQDRYRVTGTTSLATAEELQGAGNDYPVWVTNRYLQMPSTVTAETVKLAIDVIASADAKTPFDKAWAIQEYLHNTYSYALKSEVTPSGRDAVDFFLFDKKVGKCDDYATAMIVMLRSQGIPARLVSGYRSGTEQDSFGDYLYREAQGHTWVEVFFPGYGWLPFEPTQGQAPFDYNGKPNDQAASDPVETNRLDPSPVAEITATAEPTPEPSPAIGTVQSKDDQSSSGLTSGTGLAAILILALIGIVFLATIGLWLWSLRGLRPGAALFARTMRVGRLFGVHRHPTMTPAEYATEFGRTVPRASGPAKYVADLYSAETYGGVVISSEAERGGKQAWRVVRSNVARWRPWRR